MDRKRANPVALAFAVCLTPFTEDSWIDEDALRAHLRRLGSAGVGVYMGGSGSGEGLTLSRDETFRLYRIAAEELKGRVPVRAAGIEPRTAGEMIELARIAKDADLDAVQLYSILAPSATPEEVETYFADALSGVSLPAVISTHHVVGYTIPVDVVGRLVARFPGVIGVNCTRPDIRLIDLVAGKVAVHVADLGYALSNLALGGHGFLCPEANLVPRLCAALVRLHSRGDFARAASAYATLMRVNDANLRILGGFKGIKVAMALLGQPVGATRRPRLPLSDLEVARIRTTLDSLDVPGIERLADSS